MSATIYKRHWMAIRKDDSKFCQTCEDRATHYVEYADHPKIEWYCEPHLPSAESLR